MVAIPKFVGVLSCGFLLCLVSHAVQAGNVTSAAEDIKAGQSEEKGGQADQKEMTIQKQRLHIIQGDLVRVECGTYFVKEKDGKEVGLNLDNIIQMMRQIKKGDRIVAKVNDQNHALSIQAVP